MLAKLRAHEIQAFTRYKAADGTDGVTFATGGLFFKNGLYVGGTVSAVSTSLAPDSVTIMGTGGLGYIAFSAQTVAPGLAAAHIYASAGGAIVLGHSGSTANDVQINNANLTATRILYPPNKDGTIATTGDNVSQFTNDAGYVVGPGSAVSGRLPSFNGVSGKLIQDSGINIAGTSGKTLTLTGGLTIGADTAITGGGTIQLGAFIFTIPATGTAVLTSRTISEGNGLAGNTYDLSANRTLALGTPSTNSVASTNALTATSHTHAITSSANPGAAAAILASDASGYLRLVRLGIGAAPTQPLEVAGNAFINAATANLYMKDTSTGLQVSATGVITPQSGNVFRNTAYTSGLVGWNITDPGNAEFNNVDIRGALHASVIVYGQVTATAGTILTSKSAAKLRTDVTIPSSPTYGTTTVNVDAVDADGLSHASSQLFVVNDILYLKDGLVGATWLKVSSVSDQTTFWRYVCTIQAGTNNVTYRAGLGVADYGGSGSGFIVQTADATNAPYMQMATHAGTFTSANSSGTLVVTPRLRIGNLNGSYDYVTNVYGLAAGDYTGGSWIAADSNGLRIAATAGKVKIDGSGLTFTAPSVFDAAASLKWVNGTNTAGTIYTTGGGAVQMIIRCDVKSTDTTSPAGVDVIAANDQGEQAVLQMRSMGSADPTSANKSWASINGTNTFMGFNVGAGSGTAPTHMLDVYGTGWFQTSLALRDTSAAFDVSMVATSSITLTANRQLTVDMVNAARTIKFTGNPTLADWFDQSVKTTASPTFSVVTATGSNGLNLTHATSAYLVGNWTNTGGQGGLSFQESGSQKGALQMNGSAFATTARQLWMEFVNTSTGGISFWTNTTQRLDINNSGTLRARAYGAGTLTTDASGNITATSDEKLKIIKGDFRKGLDALRNLRPIRYQWRKDSGLDRSQEYVGFGARHTKRHIPEAIGKGANGFHTMSDVVILATVVNAIKELEEKYESLSNRIAA